MRTPALVAILPALHLLGCSVSGDRDDVPGSKTEALLSVPGYAPNCSAADVNYLDMVSEEGRVSANSDAVRACIYNTTHGLPFTFHTSTTVTVAPYVPCTGDPGTTADARFDAAISVLRGSNTLSIGCGGTVAPATTTQNDGLAHENPEQMIFSRAWLTSNESPGGFEDRATAAGVMFKEAFVTHGFGLCGTNNLPATVQECVRQGIRFGNPFVAGNCGSVVCSAPAGYASIPVVEVGSLGEGSLGCSCQTDPIAFGVPLITFYNQPTHSGAIGILGQTSLYTNLSYPSGFSDWTDVVALPGRLRLFYDRSSGAAVTAKIDASGGIVTMSTFNLGANWDHFAFLPAGTLEAYNSLTGALKSYRVESSGSLTLTDSAVIALGIRHLVATGTYQLLAILDSGTGYTIKPFSPHGPENGPSYSFGYWTNVVSTGDRQLFYYNRDTGASATGRTHSDGTIETLGYLTSTPGWDIVKPVFDGRIVFYSRARGQLAVGRAREDGSWSTVSVQSGFGSWSHMVANF